jgi:hypothetical protein
MSCRFMISIQPTLPASAPSAAGGPASCWRSRCRPQWPRRPARTSRATAVQGDEAGRKTCGRRLDAFDGILWRSSVTMKLATFARSGRISIGVVDTMKGEVLDLAEASRLASSCRSRGSASCGTGSCARSRLAPKPGRAADRWQRTARTPPLLVIGPFS